MIIAHKQKVNKSRRMIGITILLAYLISYIIFSIRGDYITASYGGQDWARVWVPRHLVESYRAPTGRQKVTPTIWGWFYYPCIFIDRLVWHHNLEPKSNDEI